MLIRFSCKAYADITMFGEVGKQMLSMMGHSQTVPGAILAEGIPQALASLKSAVEKEKHTPPVDLPEHEENEHEHDSVGIANRALPLIELLEAAAAEQCDVTWQDASGSSFL